MKEEKPCDCWVVNHFGDARRKKAHLKNIKIQVLTRAKKRMQPIRLGSNETRGNMQLIAEWKWVTHNINDTDV